MKKFEVNKTYTFGWIGDSDMKSYLTITHRTEKTVTFTRRGEDPMRTKIHILPESEYIYSVGKYSMSPICRAEKLVKYSSENLTFILN